VQPTVAVVNTGTPPAGSSGNPTPPKETDDKYLDIVNRANIAFKAAKYDEAKSLYLNAKNMRPADPWPSSQIIHIDNIKTEVNRNATERMIESSYRKHLATADSAFNKKAYELARMEYNEARKIKTTERYAASQLVNIDRALALESYKKEMKAGREAVSKKSYAEAEIAFNEALKSKPNDLDAKKELAKLNTLNSIQLRKTNEENTKALQLKQFNDSIAIADNMFQAGLFEEARTRYKRADKMKPGNGHVSKRIVEIDSIISVRKSLVNKSKKDSLNRVLYDNTIEKGNKALEAKDLKKAKAAYQQAITLYPDEKYPAERISAIDIMIAQEQAEKNAMLDRKQQLANAEKQYSLLISKGNAAMAKKQYEVAKLHFTQASTLKPTDKVPYAQLEIINRKLEEKRNNERYDHFIHLADSTAFSAKNRIASLPFYDSARIIKPAEVYPQRQIKAINDELLTDASKKMELQKQKERTEIFNAAYDHFKQGEDARIQHKYPEAYTFYTNFLSKLDTANVNQYLSSQSLYIRLAKDYVIRLEAYKPKPVAEPIKTAPKNDNRRRRRGNNS
jgi:tetratricopeptide (TPR) repeat protein